MKGKHTCVLFYRRHKRPACGRRNHKRAACGYGSVEAAMFTYRIALFTMCLICAQAFAQPRTDLYGDPLPDGALLRLGTVAFRVPRLAGVGFRPSGELVGLTEDLKLYVWPADGSPKPTVTSLTETKTRAGRL